MQFWIIIVIALFLQSCKSINPHLYDGVGCAAMNRDLQLRYSLFSKLSDDEIRQRRQISVPTVSALDQFSVFSEIVYAVREAPSNASLIPVDLRYYKNVELGNIIIANISDDNLISFIRNSSKYSQGFFAMINFNSDSVSLIPPSVNKLFARTKINRTDLNNVEIVINVSNSQHISGNMKFAPDQKISIIADNIAKPYRLDLREYSNLQFHLNDKWIMTVYSIENSHLKGGKDTTGLFRLVNNRNTIDISLNRFSHSSVMCYTDLLGSRF